jgi:hypothetical protein
MGLRICFLWTLLLSGAMIAAQSKNILPGGTKLIRFNLLGIMDPAETNLSFGFEYRFRDNWAISSDAAWIFYSANFEHTRHTNGFIVRPALRYYTGERKRLFLVSELHYKYVVYRIEDWLGRNCVNGTPAFEEYKRFSYRKQVIGLNLKAGYQGRISKSNRIWFELYAGIGLRIKFEDILHENNCCYTNAIGILDENFVNGKVYPAIPVGVRVLYRLWD